MADDISSLQDGGLANLVAELSAGDNPTPTTYIGDSRFRNYDDVIREMSQNPLQRDRSMVSRFSLFTNVGAIPLASYQQDNGLLLGIMYKNKDGELRNAADINMGLEQNVTPYNGFGSKKIQYLLLAPDEFEKLSKMIITNSRSMTTSTRIPTKVSNPTSRELFYEMMGDAIQKRVSDVHIEPLGNGLSRVRFRIDGSLSVANVDLTSESYKHIVSIVKTEANLRLDENRKPQDGAISFDEAMSKKHPVFKGYSMRVSTAPTHHGEKVVLRLLKEQQKAYGLESLGYSKEMYNKIRNMVESPDGLVLVTGPTGSGKTTTLYSMLNHVNNEDVNIVTIEDPIESNIPGINQSSVNKPIGWDFGNVLRTYLRQDPDIILVGEIRDTETAKAAMEAAKTGHLVLSTLHTIDSISTLLRLYELGVEKSDLQSSLNGVIAQRLVRRVCDTCKTQYDASLELNDLFATDRFSKGPFFSRGRGSIENEICQKCNGIGYYGRTVIPEVWVIGDGEKNLIGEGCKSISAYQDIAFANGLKPLAIAGMETVVAGETTIEEIIRNVTRRSEIVKRKNSLIEMISAHQKQT